MRRLAVVALALGALLIAGCGSTTPLDFKGKTRPSAPVDVSVYVNNQRVLVSPAKIGAGSALFTVANESSQDEDLCVGPAPPLKGCVTYFPSIAAGSTAQLTGDLKRGKYRLEVNTIGNDHRPPHEITTSGQLLAGAARQDGDNALLAP
jgi:hypothetical protein